MRISDGVQTCALPTCEQGIAGKGQALAVEVVDQPAARRLAFNQTQKLAALRGRHMVTDEARQDDVPTLSHEVSIIDRKSVVSGKSVSVRVDIGGRRIIKNKYIH